MRNLRSLRRPEAPLPHQPRFGAALTAAAGAIRLAARTSLIAAPLIFLPLTAAHAASRALLVGVGKYELEGIDLPGIDLDIERMRENLLRLGFSADQIHALVDEQATSAAVTEGLKTWLRDGVSANDRVVFYFSGHGSNIPDFDGDEPDGLDEVLVTHDMHRARVKGKASLTGVVVDDDIGKLIAAIPSKHVWIIVDACHSGSITRSFTLHNRSITPEPVFVKSFSYPGMPEGSSIHRSLVKAPANGAPANFVSLSAAGDREKAIGTMKGGLFTIGLTEALEQAATDGTTINVKVLRDKAAEFIASKVDKTEIHHPQISGSTALSESALPLVPASTEGLNRKRLLDALAAQPGKIELNAARKSYRVGEPVTLTASLPASGYLNVVTVDAKDNATVLFPNRLQTSNAVSAGTFSFPTKEMSFDLLASEPTGPTLVVAFLNPDPINFYQETIDDRDENGNITVDFSKLSHTATRALRVAPRNKEAYAGQLEMEITPAQ